MHSTIAKIGILLAVLTLPTLGAAASQKVNPASQINWPLVTGTTAPAGSCSSSNYGQPYTNTSNGNFYICTSTGWTLITGGGGGGIGGSGTAGYYALWSASTTLGNGSLDDAVTTAGFVTSSKPFQVVCSTCSTQVDLTYNSGHAPTPGSATTASFAPNASGQGTLSEAGAAYSRICTAANGVCGGGGTPAGSTYSVQYNNSGSFGGTGPGSAGQVLTSNGAGSAPTFQAATGGGIPYNVAGTKYVFTGASTMLVGGQCAVAGNQQDAVSAYSITSNVITVTYTGQQPNIGDVLQGFYFPTSTFLNGAQFTVTGATSSTWTAAFTHANTGATESGVMACAANAPSQAQLLEFMNGHGTVYNQTVAGTTIASIDSNYTTLLHPYAAAGNWLIIMPTGNEFSGGGCPTLGNLIASYQDVWNKWHADGGKVLQITPVGNVSNSIYCTNATTTYQALNTWFREQGYNPQSTSKPYWDQFYTADTDFFNNSDPNLFQMSTTSSSYSITSNVISFSVANAAGLAGAELTASGYGTSTFLNGVTFQNLTYVNPTTVSAAFVHANTSATENGTLTNPLAGHLTVGGSTLLAQNINATLAGRITQASVNPRDILNPTSTCGTANNLPCLTGDNSFTGTETINPGVPTKKAVVLQQSSASSSVSLIQKRNSSSSNVLAFSSNVSSGNQSIAICFNLTGGTNASVTDTLGSTYTLLADFYNPNGHTTVWGATLGSSGANTVTCTGGGAWISIFEYFGLTLTADWTATATFNSTGPTTSIGPQTTTVPDLVLTGITAPGTTYTTATIATPWTSELTDSANYAYADASFSSGAAVTANWATTAGHSASNYIAFMVAIKIATSSTQTADMLQVVDVPGTTILGALDANGKLRSTVGSSETVTFSATPTFSTSTRASSITLTGNITSFTLGAGIDGQEKTLCFTQDATGSRTVSAPSNVVNFFTVSGTANAVSCQHFTYNLAATKWYADSGGSSGGGSSFITSLTTTGTSGAATVSSGVLNIPVYSSGGGGYPAPVIASGTGVTELDLTSCITSSNRDYEIRASHIAAVSGTQAYVWQFSTNNGSTWDTTSGHYSTSSTFQQTYGGSVSNIVTSSGGTGWSIDFTTGDTWSSPQVLDSRLIIYNPLDATSGKAMTGQAQWNNPTTAVSISGGGYYTQSNAVNAIRLVAAGGATFTGTVTCQPLP